MFPRNCIKPRRLAPGATIGIVAPASPFDHESFENGLAVLQSMGFKTQPAQGLLKRRGYLAGDDAERAAQLMAAWADDTCDALMCARGGYGSLRILPYLDFSRLKDRPKPFIGFSDITALHVQLNLAAGVATFHGPTVCTLAEADLQTRTSLFQTLTSERTGSLPIENPRTIRSGLARGMLIGGNLATLCHLVGTPYARSFAGGILLLEDTGEAPYRIDRMLVQMRLAGCFYALAGLVLGQFQNCGSEHDVFHVIDDVLGDCNIPVLAGLAVGHGQTNVTLPLGVWVALDADRGELALLESPVSD